MDFDAKNLEISDPDVHDAHLERAMKSLHKQCSDLSKPTLRRLIESRKFAEKLRSKGGETQEMIAALVLENARQSAYIELLEMSLRDSMTLIETLTDKKSVFVDQVSSLS